MTMPVKNRILIGALAIFLYSTASAESSLQACAALQDSEERLRCFDSLAIIEQRKSADEFASPRVSSELEVAPPPVSTQEARETLGADHLPAKNDSKTDPEKNAEQQAREGIEFRVVNLKKDGERRHIFVMDDGQVWREIEPSQVFFPRNREFMVVINRGKMKDYRLRLNGKGKRTRVVRIK